MRQVQHILDSLDSLSIFGLGLALSRGVLHALQLIQVLLSWTGNRTFTFVIDLQNMMMVGTRNQDHHGAFSVCLKPTGEEIRLAPLTKFIFSCKSDVGVQVHVNILATWTLRTNIRPCTYFFFCLLLLPYLNTYD